MYNQSYGQFKWTKKEKLLYGNNSLFETDIRLLEFVTAVMAVYNEREKLKNSVVELRIDNTGAWKWIHTRRMNHLWGKGWMKLLESVCNDYNIVIRPIMISGNENNVADSLSRYKNKIVNADGSDLPILDGIKEVSCPDSNWREEIWHTR